MLLSTFLKIICVNVYRKYIRLPFFKVNKLVFVEIVNSFFCGTFLQFFSGNSKTDRNEIKRSLFVQVFAK